MSITDEGPITLEEARNLPYWPDSIAHQLVGWMRHRPSPAIKAELRSFLAALSPEEQRAMREKGIV